MSNETARPWSIQKRGDGLYYEIQYKREDGVMIAVQDLGFVTGRKHNLDNAKLIIKAVNAYDELIAENALHKRSIATLIAENAELKSKGDMFDELVNGTVSVKAIRAGFEVLEDNYDGINGDCMGIQGLARAYRKIIEEQTKELTE